MYDAILAETVTVVSRDGEDIEAYLARPLQPGPTGGIVVIHHMPGYDQPTKEITRRFAEEGFPAICPNLFHRQAPGAAPADASAVVLGAGGVPDEQLVDDVSGAARSLRRLSSSNGKVGVIGYCSGGRQALLAACHLDLQAAVDCYGAFVVDPPPEDLGLRAQPIAHLIPELSCPLLGLFGAEDIHPTPEEVANLEQALTDAGKEYEVHMYEEAGHAFFSVDRPTYRPEAAIDGWSKILDFFGRHIA